MTGADPRLPRAAAPRFPMAFFPDWERVGTFKWPEEVFGDEQIRREPMLFGADRVFAHLHGGPLTRAFLAHVPDFSGVVVDSKVTMLMAGQWPCIPGWHHDDVDRPAPYAQPDYDERRTSPVHYMTHLGDTGAEPEFLVEPVLVPRLREGVKVYRAWDRCLDALDPPRAAVPPGAIVRFSWQAFHRGMPAKKPGWRFWIRASVGSSRTPRNEIRTQVQVYLSDPSEGW